MRQLPEVMKLDKLEGYSEGRLFIASGYSNPPHEGHLGLVDAVRSYGQVLWILNNDRQQELKKGRVIRDEDEREALTRAMLRPDYVRRSVDQDTAITQTLREVDTEFSETHQLYFVNGGDRSEMLNVPEAAVCRDLGIIMMFGVGGVEKINSSTAINQAAGLE